MDRRSQSNTPRNRNVRNRSKKINRGKNNLFLIVSTILVMIFLVTFLKQRSTIKALQEESKKLLEIQSKTNEKIEELITEIKNANSLEYIEKRAREELGMIKEDEKIYIDDSSRPGGND